MQLMIYESSKDGGRAAVRIVSLSPRAYYLRFMHMHTMHVFYNLLDEPSTLYF